jgi:hypothetical protein
MGTDTKQLVAGLVESLEPTPPLPFSRGMVIALAALALTICLAAFGFGVRDDLAAGRPDGTFIIAGGLFLLLGVACMAASVAMSSPRVGSGGNGWGWAVAGVSLVPLAALAVALVEGEAAWQASEPEHGLVCLAYSICLGLIVATVLVSWLRRGAPTSPERAGLLTGVAAGAAGVFAFSFVCDINAIIHIGLWHGLAVTVSGIAGRLIVPHFVRW